jgi:hypothetical protein
MVIERRWKKWVYFYIPLTIFVIGTLFPFTGCSSPRSALTPSSTAHGAR